MELLRLQGFPAADWAANEQLVERYSATLGLLALVETRSDALAPPHPPAPRAGGAHWECR